MTQLMATYGYERQLLITHRKLTFDSFKKIPLHNIF